jgi:alpha-glucosidase
LKLLVGTVMGLGCAAGLAQTLARPGWVGSGMSAQPWWRAAVVYRIQPAAFQDSNGDGVGDLRGVADRLEYLQALGADAVLIESQASVSGSDAGFDDLLSEASRHHMRVLVQLGQNGMPAGAQQVLDEARLWLRRGAAGVYCPGPVLQAVAARGDAASMLRALRALADGFPGERIVLSAPMAGAVDAAAGARLSQTEPQLVDARVDASPYTAAAIRVRLTSAENVDSGEPMLDVGAGPVVTSAAERVGREKIRAALLLASRGGVAMQYGQEIGLRQAESSAQSPVMQWTPTNVTPKAVAPEKPTVHYGSYHPYVPPAPGRTRAPAMPKVEVDPSSAAPPVDPNSLPGFTAGRLPEGAHTANPMAGTVNVAVEEQDPESVLNFYRRVLALHSGNATLRSGTLYLLDHDAENALVWVRHAPAGARTVSSAVVVCNLSGRSITVSLNADLERLHVASGWVRPLLTSRHVDHESQPTGAITVAAWGVYVGELYRH